MVASWFLIMFITSRDKFLFQRQEQSHKITITHETLCFLALVAQQFVWHHYEEELFLLKLLQFACQNPMGLSLCSTMKW